MTAREPPGRDEPPNILKALLLFGQLGPAYAVSNVPNHTPLWSLHILDPPGHAAGPDVGGPLEGVWGEFHAIPTPLPICTAWPRFSVFAAN